MSVSWQSDEPDAIDFLYWVAACLCAIPVFVLIWALMQVAIRVAVRAGGVTL